MKMRIMDENENTVKHNKSDGVDLKKSDSTILEF